MPTKKQFKAMVDKMSETARKALAKKLEAEIKKLEKMIAKEDK
jgi:hypothetical protein